MELMKVGRNANAPGENRSVAGNILISIPSITRLERAGIKGPSVPFSSHEGRVDCGLGTT